MFSRIAIVNRGEAAMRLIHAVRELNAERDQQIETVALYTEGERHATFVREADITGERSEVHVFRDWCWLGTARDDAALQAIVDVPPRGEFDLDIYRLLVKQLPRLSVIPLTS